MGKIIAISAGHYPEKPGAWYNGFTEYAEAITWQNLITNMIGSCALPVPTGRLQDKVSYINSYYDVSCAIEIHFNSAKNIDGEHIGKGSETLYCPGSKAGKTLADAVQEHLSAVFPPDRGTKEGWYKMDPKNGPDFFLAKTKCPAIIVEPDFVHRKDLIAQHRIAGCRAIVKGITEWIKND